MFDSIVPQSIDYYFLFLTIFQLNAQKQSAHIQLISIEWKILISSLSLQNSRSKKFATVCISFYFSVHSLKKLLEEIENFLTCSGLLQVIANFKNMFACLLNANLNCFLWYVCEHVRFGNTR